MLNITLKYLYRTERWIFKFAYYKPLISFYEPLSFLSLQRKQYFEYEKCNPYIALIINYFNGLHYYDRYIKISLSKVLDSYMSVNNIIDYGCWWKCSMIYKAAFSYNHIWHQQHTLVLWKTLVYPDNVKITIFGWTLII